MKLLFCYLTGIRTCVATDELEWVIYARLSVLKDRVSNLNPTATSIRTTNKQQTASDFEMSSNFKFYNGICLDELKETVHDPIRDQI
jgi:hypothetical protein